MYACTYICSYPILVFQQQQKKTKILIKEIKEKWDNGLRLLFFSSFIYSAKSIFEDNLSDHIREETQLNQAHGNDGSYTRPKRAYGGILDANSLQILEEKRDMFYLLSFILHNTKPVGHQVFVMLITAELICMLLSNLIS